MTDRFSTGNLIVYLIPLLLCALLISKSIADILVVLTGLLFLFNSHIERDWRWIKDPVIILGIALTIYSLIIVSPNADKPIDTALRSISWLRFLLLYACLAHVLPKHAEQLPRAFKISLFVFFIVVLDCFYQYFTGLSFTGNNGYGRLTSFLDRPNIGTLLFKLFFSFAALYLAVKFTTQKTNRFLDNIFYLVWLLASIVILLSGERSTMLMMLGSIFVLIPGFLFVNRSHRKLAVIIIATAGLVLTILVMTQPFVQKRLVDLKTDLSDFRNSPYGHLTYASWYIAQENPITGIGYKAYKSNCKKHIDPEAIKGLCHIHPHNPYLEWLVITGFPGLLLYAALVCGILYNLLQGQWNETRRVVTAIALSSLTITLFPLLFSQSLVSNWPGILAWMSIGIAVGSVKLITAQTNQ